MPAKTVTMKDVRVVLSSTCMAEGSPEAGVDTPAVDLNEGGSAAKTQRDVFFGDLGYDGIRCNGGHS